MIIVERRVRLSGGELSLRVEIPDDAAEDPEGDALIAALLQTVAEFTGDGPVVEWKFSETPNIGPSAKDGSNDPRCFDDLAGEPSPNTGETDA
jgi:hypothetical protein